MKHSIPKRVVEAYVGEYASGKSEVAINRALELSRQGRQVSLVDLDIVEPCYTLRPIKKELSDLGVSVMAWDTSETFGLGEAGSTIRPQNRWALKRPGDIILDIGYGIEGSRTLNLLEGADKDPDLRVYAVINIYRPMTSSTDDIVQYVRELGRVDGIINNSHLGGETTPESVQRGASELSRAAAILNLPMIATSVVQELAGEIGPADIMGNPVWTIKRFMPRTLW